MHAPPSQNIYKPSAYYTYNYLQKHFISYNFLFTYELNVNIYHLYHNQYLGLAHIKAKKHRFDDSLAEEKLTGSHFPGQHLLSGFSCLLWHVPEHSVGILIYKLYFQSIFSKTKVLIKQELLYIEVLKFLNSTFKKFWEVIFKLC